MLNVRNETLVKFFKHFVFYFCHYASPHKNHEVGSHFYITSTFRLVYMKPLVGVKPVVLEQSKLWIHSKTFKGDRFSKLLGKLTSSSTWMIYFV